MGRLLECVKDDSRMVAQKTEEALEALIHAISPPQRCLQVLIPIIISETAPVLQAAIRKTFDACTVLTIAHRLHTIMDSTEVMLFEAGRLAEHAPPHTLLADPASLFSKLVDDTGSAADHLRTLAREAHEARGGA